MSKLISTILIIIITIGVIFYVFNAEIGPGLKEGGENLKEKIIQATN